MKVHYAHTHRGSGAVSVCDREKNPLGAQYTGIDDVINSRRLQDFLVEVRHPTAIARRPSSPLDAHLLEEQKLLHARQTVPQSLEAERRDRIKPGRAPGWDPAGGYCYQNCQHGYRRDCSGVCGVDSKQQGANQSPAGQAAGDAGSQANAAKRHLFSCVGRWTLAQESAQINWMDLILAL
jgi:hypothetical protein